MTRAPLLLLTLALLLAPSASSAGERAAPGPAPALERESGAAEPALERTAPARAAGDAVDRPQAAWAAARDALPAGHLVRRIAFARHGLFLFSSAPGDEAVWARFIGWEDGAWRADAPEPREADLFAAAGASAEAVDRGLARLLQSPQWQAQQDRLLSFILESHEPRLFWSLLPEPEGGLREGQALATVRLPFQPD